MSGFWIQKYLENPARIGVMFKVKDTRLFGSFLLSLLWSK